MPFQKKFNNFDGGRGDKRFGGGFKKRGFSDDRRGDTEMHSAVCAKCAKTCQVPFKPNGRKPIYCSICFVKDDFAPSRRPFGGDRQSDDLKAINAKLDTIIKMLSRDV